VLIVRLLIPNSLPQERYASVDADAGGEAAIHTILVPWFAFQKQSTLAAEALVETVVNLYRAGGSAFRAHSCH
jgi:hypothetical protein